MASIAKRRGKDGSIRWDVTVRRRGFATVCKSFPSKLAAEVWAGRLEDRIAGNDLIVTRGTLGELIVQARPYLKDPDSAALRYWESQLGDRPLRRITPQLLTAHRDALIGSPGTSPLYRKKKPRTPATARKYLIALSATFAVGMRELRVCSSNPVRLVKKPPEGTPRTRFLSDDEREALLRECRASESADLYLAVLLTITVGLRWGELRAMQWQHVGSSCCARGSIFERQGAVKRGKSGSRGAGER